MTTSRAAVLSAVSLALLATLCSGCGSGGKAGPNPGRRDAVPVVAAAARRADVPVSLSAIGAVEPISTVSVKTMIGGELTVVHFREGQDVRRGAPLFSIDPRSYDAAVRQAEANLARDRAQLENARADEKRYAALVEKDYVTREQYDSARTAVAALEATVRADDAALDNARVNLSFCTIRSPIDGRIGKLLVWQGNVVKANDVPLVTINQIRPIYVSFNAPDSRISEIRRRMAGTKLRVEVVAPGSDDAPVTGTLAFVDNTVDRSTGTILLKALFPNDDAALWPGQFVTARLVLDTRTGATVVPAEAVQTGQQGTFVFVIKPDQTVELRSVTTGATVGPDTVIEKGVAPGEQIVTDGQLRLVPGSRVEVKSNDGGRAS